MISSAWAGRDRPAGSAVSSGCCWFGLFYCVFMANLWGITVPFNCIIMSNIHLTFFACSTRQQQPAGRCRSDSCASASSRTGSWLYGLQGCHRYRRGLSVPAWTTVELQLGLLQFIRRWVRCVCATCHMPHATATWCMCVLQFAFNCNFMLSLG